MTHRFPIKEIALQAGLGTATVDRALNGRAHVSPQTRNRVHAAIRELEEQENLLAARGRRLFIDFVVEAPMRFTEEIKKATEDVLPEIGIGVFRPRFMFHETLNEKETVAILRRILKRGSHGIALKARNLQSIKKQVDALADRNIPVITLVTDLPESARIAYVGLDNFKAGQTAAHLMTRLAGARQGSVLAVRSQEAFFGEAERLAGFREMINKLNLDFEIVECVGGAGLPRNTRRTLSQHIDQIRNLLGVYSMGGGNRAILKVLEENRHHDCIFLAHDLDEENTVLLSEQKIDLVLHHDLRNDIRNLLLALGAFHRLHPQMPSSLLGDIQIITAFNIPKNRS